MSQIVIDDVLPRTQIIAANSQTIFDTNWTADSDADIVVFQRSFSAFPDDATQKLATNQFNVSFIGGSEIVQVTLVTPASLGDVITITRDTPVSRENLYTNTNFTPSMLNEDFGITTFRTQENDMYEQELTPSYPQSAVINDFDLIVPQLGPGESWVMNAAGNQITAAVAGGGSSDILAQLASHAPGEGASLIGLDPAGTVQDLANAKFIIQAPNTAVPNAQSLSSLTTGILKSTTSTGVVSISAPLSSIDSLTTAADETIYTTAPNVYATTPLTAVARALLAETSFTGIAILLGALPLTGGTMSGVIDMGNNKISNLTDPTNNQDAATRIFVTSQLANYLPLAGGTMAGVINMNSHNITGLNDPVNSQDAATKAYVDLVATGLTVQGACYAATTGNLTGYTYANGASGIGATLTAGSNGVFTTDGVTPPVNSRIFIPFQTSTLQNGIYNLTVSNSGLPAILTRASDYDQPAEINPGDFIIVNNGTLYGTTSWIETVTVTAIGTDPILFSQFTFAPTSFLLKASNLSDVANKTTAFDNISPATTKGDLIGFNGTNNVRVAVGTINNQILQVNSAAATGISYSTATYPATTTINQILYSSATNVIGGITAIGGGVLVTDNSSVPQFLANPAAIGKVLMSGNATIPTWSTALYPTLAGTTGNVMTSDGTNWVSSPATTSSPLTTKGDLFTYTTVNARLGVASGDGKILQVSSGASTGLAYSTATYPVTAGSAGNLMTSDGTNWVSSPASVLSGRLIGIQVFSSTGAFNYTPALGIGSATVEGVSGGGGSGGCAGSGSTLSASGGGGGGAYMMIRLTASQIGAGLSGTVGVGGAAGTAGNNNGGTGGNSTLATASAWTLTGGAGGTGSAAVSGGGSVSAAGGAGGTVTSGTGTIIKSIAGQTGGFGKVTLSGGSSIQVGSGKGGDSGLGLGGAEVFPLAGGSSIIGMSGTGYGAGAGGSATFTGANTAGRLAQPGYFIFYEYS